MRYRLITLLTALIATLMTIEGLLRLTDPWGLLGFDDWAVVYAHIVPHPTRGYVLAPGAYHFSRWTVTELPGGLRYLPDGHTGPCTLVFLGDSVTFATGVSDGAAWVNRVASQLPGVTVLNLGFDGYNSQQVRALLADYPDADAAIYLVIANDNEATVSLVGQVPHVSDLPMLSRYLLFANGRLTAHPATDPARFERDLTALSADRRVTLVAFDDAFGQALARRWPVTLIAWYTDYVSTVDRHAGVLGNRQLAASMLPIARRAVRAACR